MLWQPRSGERAHGDGSDMDFELLSPVIFFDAGDDHGDDGRDVAS